MASKPNTPARSEAEPQSTQPSGTSESAPTKISSTHNAAHNDKTSPATLPAPTRRTTQRLNASWISPDKLATNLRLIFGLGNFKVTLIRNVYIIEAPRLLSPLNGMLINFEKLTAKLRSVFGAGNYEVTLMHDVYTIKASRLLTATEIAECEYDR
ncbi:hypothetical protein QBC34DRAFT_470641 [Podospora aff. communis PSN243]|uniref:Uncharacterized protein n=1 Tax=Podospora aff. communis PSN243 TaxID=3040156 RepID=A0AAV9GC80_9PEZI|nr:hypothetical protein QBC34DRAFT_470641 [Podospora aff. communis PSN243]